jgi:hypothetical protein
VGVVDPDVSTEWPAPEQPPSPYTIDTVTLTPWSSDSGSDGRILMATISDIYSLSNHTSWDSGAGSSSSGRMALDTIVRDGALILYRMLPDALFLERIAYDNGEHHAHARFETLGDWTIVAAYGSTTATLSAELLITADEPVNYVDSRFNYLSAPLCSVVPVVMSYSLTDANKVFDEHLFESNFGYFYQGAIDLTQSRP